MEISAGDWIQIAITIVGMFLFIWRVGAILGEMQVKVDTLWKIFIDRRRQGHREED